MPYQKVNGIQVYYEDQGQGYPVLLIQGLGYPSGMWFRQIPELAQQFRVLVIDNRGVGKTDKPDEEYTIALMASDAAGLLRSLGIRKAHIIGVSMGGYIAQELALSDPDMVNRLILLATSCGGPRYMELTKSLWDEVAALAGLPPREIIRRGMVLATTPDFYEKNPGLIERSVAIRLENLQPLFAFIRQSHAAYSFNSTDRAHQIRQPTFILAGAHDRVMPLSLTQELAQKIPRSRLKAFPDAAHLLFLEKAESVNQDIGDFLSR
ncbi:MAG: alpha/beta hydrolase [Deltaproteobacteria bacterium]|nr:alpha/beta hydrolase [Deltaproteobacteria bacterium]